MPETPIGLVRGTRDWLPGEYDRTECLRAKLLHFFGRAGYDPMRTPILEFTELHERKSGAGIVAKLFELSDVHHARLCLRPELTASIVRAYAAMPEEPPLPWRVAACGPVFRFVPNPQPGYSREFTQAGVELIGAAHSDADAEIIWLADASLRELGFADIKLCIGHVGLILELFERSGLPASARSSLIDSLSEAAASGGDVRAVELVLDHFEAWLSAAGESAVADAGADMVQAAESPESKPLRFVAPEVEGRRSSAEIFARLRRKRQLAHSLRGVLEAVRGQVRRLADMQGPAVDVLQRLETEFATLAPRSVDSLRQLINALSRFGLKSDQIELDLGFGRGIGFYTSMVFEINVVTPQGAVEVGGGGRYDGLARVLGSEHDSRGVGFAFGLERLLEVLDGPSDKPLRPARGWIVASAEQWRAEAVRLATRKRMWGSSSYSLSFEPIGREEALERARALGCGSVYFVEGPIDQPGAVSIFMLGAATDKWRAATSRDVGPTGRDHEESP